MARRKPAYSNMSAKGGPVLTIRATQNTGVKEPGKVAGRTERLGVLNAAKKSAPRERQLTSYESLMQRETTISEVSF